MPSDRKAYIVLGIFPGLPSHEESPIYLHLYPLRPTADL